MAENASFAANLNPLILRKKIILAGKEEYICSSKQPFARPFGVQTRQVFQKIEVQK
jgi:hypothetical protein